MLKAQEKLMLQFNNQFMKQIIMLLLLFTLNISNTQNTDIERDNISLSIILPNNSELLSQKSISKIESKIQHIVTANGISGKGYSNEFLIYPKFEIFNESTIEGMRNMVIIEVDFSLYIQQFSTKKIFSSYSKSLKGSGYTKEKAITNAISKISKSDSKLTEFIEQGKNKILDYYKNNCDQIIADSNMLIQTKKYQRAIALLSSVPKEAKTCYASIQNKSIEAYNAYQKQICKQNIIKAKTELAKKNYNGALRILSFIDPSSPCNSEAEKLIKSTAKKVNSKEQKEWNLMLRKYNDKVSITKYRLDTMKEIAKAYYNSKPKTVIYKSLF